MFALRLYLTFILLLPGLVYANATIVVLGDSLSAGYGLRQSEGWVSLLAERLRAEKLPYNVVNASISGDTTSGGLRRLPKLLTQHQPRILILELGGNDGLRGLSLDDMQSNLNKIIRECKELNIDVLLVGLNLPPNYGPQYTQRFAKVFSDLAQKENVPVVPSLLTGLEDNLDLYQADTIHPTAQAQPIMLENVWRVLAPALLPTPHPQEVTSSRK